MKIIEIGGADGSGKSTQIKEISKYYSNKGYKVITPPSLIEFCNIFPRTLGERREWYVKADPEEIVLANILGAKGRNEYCFYSKCDLILLDRGFITITSSAAARLMTNNTYDEAKNYVTSLSKEKGYCPIEHAGVIYHPPIRILIERLGNEVNPSFKEYLEIFWNILEHDQQNQYTIKKIASVKDIISIKEESINFLEEILQNKNQIRVT